MQKLKENKSVKLDLREKSLLDDCVNITTNVGHKSFANDIFRKHDSLFDFTPLLKQLVLHKFHKNG